MVPRRLLLLGCLNLFHLAAPAKDCLDDKDKYGRKYRGKVNTFRASDPSGKSLVKNCRNWGTRDPLKYRLNFNKKGVKGRVVKLEELGVQFENLSKFKMKCPKHEWRKPKACYDYVKIMRSATIDGRNARLEMNFCRNPSNDPKGPWCFDQENRIQYCSVPTCQEKQAEKRQSVLGRSLILSCLGIIFACVPCFSEI